jgi:hypothetical protein
MASFGRTRRCNHVKVTGHRCGSPALRGEELCYFHSRLFHRIHSQIDRAISPIALLENEEAIQVSIMTVIDSILKGSIELKRAELILRALSLAERNSRRARFDFKPDEMIRRAPIPLDTPPVEAADTRSAASPKPSPSKQSEEPALPADNPVTTLNRVTPLNPVTTLNPDPTSTPCHSEQREESAPAGSVTTPVPHPAYSEFEKATSRRRHDRAHRNRPLTSQQTEENHALHEIECAVQGAQRGDLNDFQKVMQTVGILDDDGHL